MRNGRREGRREENGALLGKQSDRMKDKQTSL